MQALFKNARIFRYTLLTYWANNNLHKLWQKRGHLKIICQMQAFLWFKAFQNFRDAFLWITQNSI